MKKLLISLMTIVLLTFTTQVAIAQANTSTTEQVEKSNELKLSKDDKIFLGVAGGIGEHLGVDPDLIRLGFILLSVVYGVGLISYLICYIFMV